MKVLAIDSAMNGCTACICEIGGAEEIQVLAQEKLEIPRGQAEHLMPMIERVMNNAETTYNTLDLIGVTNGPGAFTGMRIAIATAKAIALAADKPVIGVSTILSVLESYLSIQTYVKTFYPYYAVILETKRKDYYFQMFENIAMSKQATIEELTEVTPARVAGASEISSIISKKDIMLIGDATNRLMSECTRTWPSHEIVMPEGKYVAKLAANFYRKNEKNEECKPVYLREAEIGKAKIKPRLIKS
ncbi:MAG: tRNA (adenosine(37)-N6)-threonylcarbamoyltransferase complex dimerization subunit type 1 TsaB [Alphaproteobacteria bacterium]|nr:tRNA (adenosine(37)-N6)-threonylcarbamoyltransferase complex dimerization subunit type 1 TsaB [Alphaproteobacteria bacterium]